MASESKRPRPPADYDPMPELTDEEIKQLRPARELFEEMGIPMPVPRGRPKAERPKKSVTMRVDAEALDYFKSTGSGWQTRVNDLLVKEARRLKKSA
jgi:uncharacterized protein (DUF4415 family)